MELNITLEEPKREPQKKLGQSAAYRSFIEAGYKPWAVVSTKTMDNNPLYTSILNEKDKYIIQTLTGVNEDGTYATGKARNKTTLIMILVKK